MIYHHPSFMHYLLLSGGNTFDILCYNWQLYIISSRADFTPAECYRVINSALIESLERPLVTLRGTRSRTLFVAPPEPYCAALSEALFMAWKHLYLLHTITNERGEQRRQYKFNMLVIADIVRNVRRSEDFKLSADLLTGEGVMSHRLLCEKIFNVNGRDIGRRRSIDTMKDLIGVGYGGYNGRRRTAGMEVWTWPNS